METAKIREDIEKKKFINDITKKAFQRMVMPPIGTQIEDGSRVMYVNYGQMRFTAVTDDLPKMGIFLEWKDMAYEVCYLNPKKSRFSAKFVGFKKPIERPEEDTSQTVKLLDD